MTQTWRQLPIVVQYIIDYTYHNQYEKNQLFSFCVICRPDFNKFCHTTVLNTFFHQNNLTGA